MRSPVPALRTRPPDAQQEEQILHTNVAAAVEVGGAISLRRARPPDAQQDEQILHANVAAGVEIPRAHSGGGSIKEVCRAGADAVVVVQVCPNDGDSLRDRHGTAEVVACRAVVGQELGDLPARGGVKQVGGAGVGAVVVDPPGPD